MSNPLSSRPESNRANGDVPVRLFVTLALLPALLIVLALLQGIFARPLSDDFCYSNILTENGFWSSILFWRDNFNSRFSSTLLLNLFIGRFDILGDYWLIPTTTIALLWIGITCFFSIALGYGKAAAWSIVLIGIYLATITNPQSTVFWAPGAITYQWGISFSFLLLAVVLRPKSGSTVSELLMVALSILLAAFNAFFNELVALISLGVLLLLLLARHTRDARLARIICAITVIVWALSYMLTAKGTGYRLESHPGSQDIFYALIRSILKGLQFSVPTALVMVMLGLIAVVDKVLYPIARAMQGVFGPSRHIVTLGLFFLVPTLTYFTLFFSLGAPGPSRAHSLNYLWALTIWPLCHLAYRDRLVRINRLVSGTRRQIVYSLAVVCLLTVILNPIRYLQDLYSGASADWAAGMDERYRTLRESDAAARVITVPRLVIPQVLGFEDLGTDWKDWRNGCMARYFGVSGLRLSN